MTARNYYHVGILVDDIVAARDRFGAITGLTFTPVETFRFPHFEDSRGKRELELVVCYSTEGPPFLELVQSDPEGGVYGRQGGEGLHHLGFHEPDVAGRMDRLEHDHGLTLEGARFGNKDAARMAAAYTSPSGLNGVRLEIVDERGRVGLYEWLASFAQPR
jgi:catechol 2,3-dioxygenase-like lactoylglutathione lyase family enzyme